MNVLGVQGCELMASAENVLLSLVLFSFCPLTAAGLLNFMKAFMCVVSVSLKW